VAFAFGAVMLVVEVALVMSGVGRADAAAKRERDRVAKAAPTLAGALERAGGRVEEVAGDQTLDERGEGGAGVSSTHHTAGEVAGSLAVDEAMSAHGAVASAAGSTELRRRR
jgi:hypothetical protein